MAKLFTVLVKGEIRWLKTHSLHIITEHLR